MTANQINYWKLQEDKRHNEETERLSNIQRQEEIRHNLVGEGLNQKSLEESVRHNTVTEGEAYRSNVMKEAENQRSNVARETETERANRAYEAELTRHNRASESLGYAGISESYAELAELGRHNQISEGLSLVTTDLTKVRDDRSAALSSYKAREEARHNIQIEKEQKRSNIAQESELLRSHVASEKLRKQELIVDALGKVGDLIIKQENQVTNGIATIGKLLPISILGN